MKKLGMRKSLIIFIITAVLMLALSTISFADTPSVDLTTLEPIREVTPTPTPTPTATPTPTQTSSGATQAQTGKLPQTGSNAEVIFAIGLITLTSGAIFMYRKTKIF